MSPYRGTTALSRWGYRRGLAVDAALVNGADRMRSTDGRATLAYWWLVAVSAVIVLAALVCVGVAAWLWVATDLPVGVRLVFTLALLALAWFLAPRVGSAPKVGRLADGQGPEFRRLVADVAAAVGAPPPDIIVFDMGLNAGVARVGWRGQSVLALGAPLWTILTPAARISLLAHEFGHLVNGDPMRRRATLPARTFGARAVAATGGRNPWSRAFATAETAAWHGGDRAGLAGLLIGGTMAAVNTAGATVQLLVDAVAMPDSRRAELRADLKAIEVGGTAAFVESEDYLLMADGIYQDLWDRAPRIGPEDLPDAIRQSAELHGRELDVLRQASVRHTDLWSSHPSSRDRIRVAESTSPVQATLQVPSDRWSAIDSEMSAWSAHIHKTLLGTRDRISATGSR
jgi:Zn-dependent protease with chaperone function